MSWSMCLVWPEICEVTDEYDMNQAIKDRSPLLPADWAVWRVEIESVQPLLDRLREAGFGALLSFHTEGMGADEIVWASPTELAKACSSLRSLVLQGEIPLIQEILGYYENYSERGISRGEAFADDLDAIAKSANRAASLGHEHVTLSLAY